MSEQLIIDPPRNGEVAARSADGGGLPFTRKPTVYAARKLRKSMSLPEVMLWQRLRGSPQGMRFRRQHPIGPYIIDFYCSRARIVIEIDGQNHSHGDRPERDVRREVFLTENGYRLIRIAAAEVLQDVDAVAEGIIALASRDNPPRYGEAAARSADGGGLQPEQRSCDEPPPPPLRGGPPPRAGEDF